VPDHARRDGGPSSSRDPDKSAGSDDGDQDDPDAATWEDD
jgi:hypothetical protein